MLMIPQTVALEVHQVPGVESLQHMATSCVVQLKRRVANGDCTVAGRRRRDPSHSLRSVNSDLIHRETLLLDDNVSRSQSKARVNGIGLGDQEPGDATTLLRITEETKFEVQWFHTLVIHVLNSCGDDVASVRKGPSVHRMRIGCGRLLDMGDEFPVSPTERPLFAGSKFVFVDSNGGRQLRGKNAQGENDAPAPNNHLRPRPRKTT
mmetsp:Transcript_45045/g.119464  ORF Transcript_45045/g.119464 Transcript_45045/m.119464 type:complete len:207 (+) Transcript_45045:2319-2939(+)